MMKNAKDMDKQMGKLQVSMLKMHEQMHKIMDEKNPQEQDKLMQMHRKLMHEHMQEMKDMMGQGMMSGVAKSGSGMGTDKHQKGAGKH
jgi:hypothetical protein